ncbi:MAG: NAD(+) synthase [Candidatus Woesebacteria bacterium]
MDSIPEITGFLKKVFTTQAKTKAVIAVSGGIDSALSLTLLAKTLPKDQIFPLFLPYGDQSTQDAKTICTWNQIPTKNWKTVDIKPAVDLLSQTLAATDLRKGNIMARVRMIIVFDIAKRLDALVCGTENKSEHYLGYFTRFGDSASDIEPLCHLYKTQIREIAETLDLPKVFLEKAPSAGLWDGQTDENEMGFTYEEADRAIEKYLQDKKAATETEQKVFSALQKADFKLHVPYSL